MPFRECTYLTSRAAFIALGAIVWLAQPAGAAQASPPPVVNIAANAGRMVLGEYPAGPAGLRYEVALAPCAKGECTIQVLLLDGDRIAGKYDLRWKGSSRDVSPEPATRGLGAGDPLRADTTIKVWRSGDEAAAVSTAARVITLAPGLNGLLVDQRAGFEHVKREHALYSAIDGKLVRIWTASEGAGPTWSTTAVVNADEHRQGVVLYQGFIYPSDDEPDKLSATALVWDSVQRKMVSFKTRLYGFLSEPFVSIAAARQARSEYRQCRVALWVLPAKSFPDRPSSGFVLAAMGSEPSAAEEAVAMIKQCAPTAKVSLFQMDRAAFSVW